MKTILIDLDNTLFCNDVVENICNEYGVAVPTKHDLTDLPTEVKDKCYSEFGNEERMCSLKPFPEALGIDKELKDAGHNVIVVTSRTASLREGTQRMIDRHFPCVDKLIMLESYNKYDTYVELKADVVIDDHSVHVEQALDAGVEKVYMVSTPFTRYNHAFREPLTERGAIVVENVQVLKNLI